MANLGGTSDDAVHLKGLLVEYMHDIDVTRRVLPKVPARLFSKFRWDQVISMAQMLGGEATVVGKLWTGICVTDLEALSENLREFFGLLQRLIILGFGAVQAVAGITLASRMRLSLNRIIDVSVLLIKEAVLCYGERGTNEDQISKMIAAVWEAFCILKTTPSNNATAIGEALQQATVSIKEDLRVMKEVMEQVKDKASDESGSSTEQQKEADTPEIIKDEADGDGGSRLKELEDVKDEASVDDDSELKATSSDKNKEISCHLPEKFKDGASGDEGCSLKELEKGSVKDEASVDDGSGVVDEASVDYGSDLDDEEIEEFLEFKPDEMSVDELTYKHVTEELDMLNNLGKAMTSLSKREEERVLVDFVDSLENMFHAKCSLIKEAVVSKDSEIPKLTAASKEYYRALLKSRRTSSRNNITETTKALAQVTLSIKEAAVGESLCDLKNSPPNNVDELAETLAEVSLSMKENASQMEEQKEASGEAGSSTEQQQKEDEASGELLEDVKDEVSAGGLGKDVKDEVSAGELGKDVKDETTEESGSSWPSDDGDLTPKEITTARIATDAISGILEMMNLLGPAVAGLQFTEKKGTVENFVGSLEKILKLSLAIQSQTGEFRMCVFHPQEISVLIYAFGNIYFAMRNISVELNHVAKDLHFPKEFSKAWGDAVEKIKKLDHELHRRDNED